MSGAIPALTLWQPWASLIAAGAKPYEWRGWKAPAGMVGRRIAIHAGARKVRHGEVAGLVYSLEKSLADQQLAWSTSLIPAIAYPLLQRWLIDPGGLPLSSVLCTAILGTPITAAAYAAAHGVPPADSDRINHTMWGWPLTDVEVLEPFIPARGAQGFWTWTP
jgi:hypothetical protein